jgi:hypothetical protein
MAAPTDAQVWDSTTLGFKNAGSGVTARSSVNYTFTFGKWHDGESFNMNDVLYEMALVFRRADSRGDVYAKDSDAATFASILLKDIMRGFKVTQPNKLQVWYNYWNVDPTTIASEINPAFPATPWTASELALQTVFTNSCRISEVTAQAEGRDALDLTKGGCLANMTLAMPSFSAANHLPPGNVVDATEAAARWSQLWAFKNLTGHFFASNGPMVLTKVDEVAVQTTMNVDPNYPIDAAAYDAYLVPRVPQISFAPPPTVLIGRIAPFSVTSKLQGGGAYDKFDMTWFVVNPATGQPIPGYSGKPTKIASGQYEIDLTPAQTKALQPGAYELRSITVGQEAAIPVIVSESFIAIPDVDTLLAQLRAEIQSLQNNFNTQLLDQKNLTAAAQAQVGTLQTLVIVALALAVVAIVAAVVVIMRARAPRMKGGTKPPEEEEI